MVSSWTGISSKTSFLAIDTSEGSSEVLRASVVSSLSVTALLASCVRDKQRHSTCSSDTHSRLVDSLLSGSYVLCVVMMGVGGTVLLGFTISPLADWGCWGYLVEVEDFVCLRTVRDAASASAGARERALVHAVDLNWRYASSWCARHSLQGYEGLGVCKR